MVRDVCFGPKRIAGQREAIDLKLFTRIFLGVVFILACDGSRSDATPKTRRLEGPHAA